MTVRAERSTERAITVVSYANININSTICRLDLIKEQKQGGNEDKNRKHEERRICTNQQQNMLQNAKYEVLI